MSTQLRGARPQAAIDVEGAGARVVLSGDWTLSVLNPRCVDIRRQLEAASGAPAWDLAGVSRLDSFGALLLWRAWRMA